MRAAATRAGVPGSCDGVCRLADQAVAHPDGVAAALAALGALVSLAQRTPATGMRALLPWGDAASALDRLGRTWRDAVGSSATAADVRLPFALLVAVEALAVHPAYDGSRDDAVASAVDALAAPLRGTTLPPALASQPALLERLLLTLAAVCAASRGHVVAADTAAACAGAVLRGRPGAPCVVRSAVWLLQRAVLFAGPAAVANAVGAQGGAGWPVLLLGGALDGGAYGDACRAALDSVPPWHGLGEAGGAGGGGQHDSAPLTTLLPVMVARAAHTRAVRVAVAALAAPGTASADVLARLLAVAALSGATAPPAAVASARLGVALWEAVVRVGGRELLRAPAAGVSSGGAGSGSGVQVAGDTDAARSLHARWHAAAATVPAATSAAAGALPPLDALCALLNAAATAATAGAGVRLAAIRAWPAVVDVVLSEAAAGGGDDSDASDGESSPQGVSEEDADTEMGEEGGGAPGAGAQQLLRAVMLAPLLRHCWDASASGTATAASRATRAALQHAALHVYTRVIARLPPAWLGHVDAVVVPALAAALTSAEGCRGGNVWGATDTPVQHTTRVVARLLLGADADDALASTSIDAPQRTGGAAASRKRPLDDDGWPPRATLRGVGVLTPAQLLRRVADSGGAGMAAAALGAAAAGASDDAPCPLPVLASFVECVRVLRRRAAAAEAEDAAAASGAGSGAAANSPRDAAAESARDLWAAVLLATCRALHRLPQPARADAAASVQRTLAPAAAELVGIGGEVAAAAEAALSVACSGPLAIVGARELLQLVGAAAAPKAAVPQGLAQDLGDTPPHDGGGH